MKINKQLIVAGITVSALGLLVVGPTTSATYGGGSRDDDRRHSLERLMRRDDGFVKLASESNDDIKVSAKLDQTHHILLVKVKNKTDSSIRPSVSFNGEDPTFKTQRRIKPDRSATYFWSFSGNQFTADITVAGKKFTDLTMSPQVDFNEAISFKVSDTTATEVMGTLTNNTSEPQTVYTRANHGDKQETTLAAGESTDITVSVNDTDEDASTKEHKYAYVSVKTDDYRGSYWVALKESDDSESH